MVVSPGIGEGRDLASWDASSENRVESSAVFHQGRLRGEGQKGAIAAKRGGGCKIWMPMSDGCACLKGLSKNAMGSW